MVLEQDEIQRSLRLCTPVSHYNRAVADDGIVCGLAQLQRSSVAKATLISDEEEQESPSPSSTTAPLPGQQQACEASGTTVRTMDRNQPCNNAAPGLVVGRSH